MPTPFEARQAREAMALTVVEELHRLGAWTTSPAPLHDAKIRFDVLADQAAALLEKIGGWGWNVRPCGTGHRIVPSGNAALMRPTSAYELELPREKEAPQKPAGGDVISSDEYQKLLEGFRKGLG